MRHVAERRDVRGVIVELLIMGIKREIAVTPRGGREGGIVAISRGDSTRPRLDGMQLTFTLLDDNETSEFLDRRANVKLKIYTYADSEVVQVAKRHQNLCKVDRKSIAHVESCESR